MKDSADTGAFSPELAIQCARSVAFNQTACRLQLAEIRNFLASESTQDYWKSPPSSISLPPIDLEANLNDISSKVERNGYDTKYDFDMNIYNILVGLHDGHTAYITPTIGSFVYYHKFPIISVSEDPETPPKIYLADLATGGPIMGAGISQISGVSASDYIGSPAANATSPPLYWIDPDTNYNQLFVPQSNPEQRSSQLENLGTFAARDVFPTDRPQLTLTNNTKIPVDWYAMFNWWGLESLAQAPWALPFQDQASFENMGGFDTFIGPSSQQPSSPPKAKHVDDLNPYSPTPTAINTLSHNAAAYYVVDDAIGVFQLHSFEAYSRAEEYANETQFVNNILSLTDEALKYFHGRGIRKVVIDLTHNGGGDTAAGLAIFRHFFPNMTNPSLYQNYRWSLQLDAITRKASISPQSLDTVDVVTFGDQYKTTTDGQPFVDINNYLGPYTSTNNGLFTKKSTLNMTKFIEEFGYNPNPPQPQLFNADQLALLSDTICASTCATFSQLMADQGVRSVAYGGRPGRPSLQLSGGVKGRYTYAYSDWLTTSSAIPNTQANRKWLPKPPPYTMGLRVNLANGFTNRKDQWPAELSYRAATKSVYLTEKMATSPEERWRVAAKQIWG